MSELTLPAVEKKVLIRQCAPHELPMLLQLSAFDGRNPGVNDADVLYQLDPNGFFLAVEEGDRFAGSISALTVDESFGFIGHHFIMPEFQSTGVEDALLKLALERMGTRNAGLNCTEDQVGYYSAFGFKPFHKILTYEGVASGEAPSYETIVSPFKYPFEYLSAADRDYYHRNRKDILPRLLQQAESLLLAELDGKKFSGYGLSAPCQNGMRLGPLVSASETAAEHLVLSLTGCMASGTRYFLDVPEPNENAVRLAERLGMNKIGETIRMYRNDDAIASLTTIYSFTHRELG